MSPTPRKVLQLLWLRQLHNGVFLKVNKHIWPMLKLINSFVANGYPSLKTVRELVYKRGFCARINQDKGWHVASPNGSVELRDWFGNN